MANTYHQQGEPDYDGFARDVLAQGADVEADRLADYYDQAVTALRAAMTTHSSEPMDNFAAEWLR